MKIKLCLVVTVSISYLIMINKKIKNKKIILPLICIIVKLTYLYK